MTHKPVCQCMCVPLLIDMSISIFETAKSANSINYVVIAKGVTTVAQTS